MHWAMFIELLIFFSKLLSISSGGFPVDVREAMVLRFSWFKLVRISSSFRLVFDETFLRPYWGESRWVLNSNDSRALRLCVFP